MPRFIVVATVLTLCGILVIGRAAYLIAADKEYWLGVDSVFVKRDSLPSYPQRGDILADGGEVLAASVPEYRLFIDFRSYETDSTLLRRDRFRRYLTIMTNMDTIVHGLYSVFPDIDTVKLQEKIIDGFRRQTSRLSLYHRRITYIEYAELIQHDFFKRSTNATGFRGDEYEVRKKPYGSLAGRTVGDVNIKDKLCIPRTGIEKALNDTLRGQLGTSHRRRILSRYVNESDSNAVNGYDVQTTLNITMQEICEKALRDRLVSMADGGTGGIDFGLCILMEVATGDIKAMVSLEPDGKGGFVEKNDQAVSYASDPGSVFKPVSFLVAFNEHKFNLETKAETGGGKRQFYGRTMTDHNVERGGYGTLTARMCIANSSNIGVSLLIDNAYRNNPQAFFEGVMATGIGEDLQIPLPGYQRPYIKGPHHLKTGDHWYKTDLPWMSHGYVTKIAPINTVTFYNGLANGGRMMHPRLIKALLRDGQVVEEFAPQVLREHMASADAVRDVQDCLRAVVTVGVGRRFNSRKIHIAGKTGTAVDYSGGMRGDKRFVSFAGYFPYENPQYSCIVCVKKSRPAGGAMTCMPVFVNIAETILAQELKTDYRTAKDSVHVGTPSVMNGDIAAAGRVLNDLNLGVDGISDDGSTRVVWGKANVDAQRVSLQTTSDEADVVPDVLGYGLRDALFRLEGMGMKVDVHGAGRVVRQSVKPGTKAKRGDAITIYLGMEGERAAAIADSIQNRGPKASEVTNDTGNKRNSDSASVASKKPQEKKPAPKKKDDERSPATPANNRAAATNKNKR